MRYSIAASFASVIVFSVSPLFSVKKIRRLLVSAAFVLCFGFFFLRAASQSVLLLLLQSPVASDSVHKCKLLTEVYGSVGAFLSQWYTQQLIGGYFWRMAWKILSKSNSIDVHQAEEQQKAIKAFF